MTRVKLVSEKYWDVVVNEDQKRIRKAKNAKAIDSFVAFVLACVLIFGFVYAFQNQDQWVPAVETFFTSL